MNDNTPIWAHVFGKPAKLFVTDHQAERMLPLHFRGHTVNKAGNFCQKLWCGPSEVIHDLKHELEEEIEGAINEGDFETRSVTITCDEYVGWSSTSTFNKHLMKWYERFEPNHRSTALRFRPEAPYCASPTKDITLVYQVFESGVDQGHGYHVSFKTMYPGTDIGELVGDITKNEGVVFYDWEHTGAPLSEPQTV